MKNREGLVIILLLFIFITYLYFFINLPYYQKSITYRNESFVEENLTLNNLALNVILTAKDILGNEPFVFFTMINKPFTPFMKNWICNVINMDSILSKTLIVTTDEEAFKELQNIKFQLFDNAEQNLLNGTYAHSYNSIQFYLKIYTHKYVLYKKTDGDDMRLFTVLFYPLNIEMQNSLSYGNIPYLTYMNHRTYLIKELLNNNIPVFLFESDAYWSTNPLPNIFPNLLNGTKQKHTYDIIGHKVSKTNLIGGGFLYLHPNNATIALWHLVNKEFSMHMNKTIQKYQNDPKTRQKNFILFPEINDQSILNKLLHNKTFNSLYKIKYKILDSSLYADGAWYKQKLQKSSQKPIVIQNNWIIGNDNKIKRMKKYKQYFLGPNHECQY